MFVAANPTKTRQLVVYSGKMFCLQCPYTDSIKIIDLEDRGSYEVSINENEIVCRLIRKYKTFAFSFKMVDQKLFIPPCKGVLYVYNGEKLQVPSVPFWDTATAEKYFNETCGFELGECHSFYKYRII